MRTALIGGALVAAALAFAAPASAGCWATVGLAPPPAGTAAGQIWTAEITVLQHGRNPLPDAGDARPTVTIVNRGSGERRTFTATASDPAAGRYEAQVVFPSSGTWSYAVFDGFTSWNGEPAPCAQTHTFAAVEIGGASAGPRPGSSGTPPAGAGAFPLWPLLGGLAVLLLVGAGALGRSLHRHGSRARATI